MSSEKLLLELIRKKFGEFDEFNPPEFKDIKGIDHEQYNDWVSELHENLSDHYRHPFHSHEMSSALRRYSASSLNLNHFLLHGVPHPVHRNISAYNDSEENGFDNLHEKHHFDNATTHLRRVIGQNNPAPFDFHVYTGIGYNPTKLSAKHSENHVHFPAFTSTSAHYEQTRYFARRGATSRLENLDFNKLRGLQKKYFPDSEPINEYDTFRKTNVANALSQYAPKHILRIKIHKGTKFGHYIGDHSSSGNEYEYMLKNNLIMHIDQHQAPGREYSDKTYHIWNAHIVGEK